MKRYKHTIVMILLVIAAFIAGYGFICFSVEHISLSLLRVSSITCALPVKMAGKYPDKLEPKLLQTCVG